MTASSEMNQYTEQKSEILLPDQETKSNNNIDTEDSINMNNTISDDNQIDKVSISEENSSIKTTTTIETDTIDDDDDDDDNNDDDNNDDDNNDDDNNDEQVKTTIPIIDDNQEYLNDIPINIKWLEIKNTTKLIENKHTIIYTGTYLTKSVVIKTINNKNYEDNDTVIKDLEDELVLLSKLKHSNIITLYGAGYIYYPNDNKEHAKKYRFIILEYCQNGTLDRFVGKNKCIKCQKDDRDDFCFSIKDALMNARCIADAMLYLHNSAMEGNMILHRDLKPDNIGLTKDGKVKLLDFGLAKIINKSSSSSSNNNINETYKMTGLTGTLLYMAPEVATLQPYNHTADVYSFGILLWQLLTCEQPYCCIETKLLYRDIVMNFVRPSINSKKAWPKELINLIQLCWHPDYEIRPNFEQVIKSLDYIINNLIDDRKKSFDVVGQQPWSTATMILSYFIPFLALYLSFYLGSFLFDK